MNTGMHQIDIDVTVRFAVSDHWEEIESRVEQVVQNAAIRAIVEAVQLFPITVYGVSTVGANVIPNLAEAGEES